MLQSTLTTGVADTQAAKPLLIYPFTIEGDHIVIEATVNGRPGRFIVDSGAGASVVTSEFSEGLDLNLAAAAQATGAGSGTTAMRRGRGNIGIGQLTLENVPIVVLAVSPFKAVGSDISGLVGYDVLAKWTVAIDFVQNTLTFFDPEHYTPDSGALNIPIDISKRVPIVTIEVSAQQDAPPVQAKLMVDTGAPTFPFLFSQDYAARAGLNSVEPRRTVALGIGTNGVMMGDILRVATSRFAGLPLHDAVVGVSHDKTGFFASGLADGTVGQALFRRGALTFDYPHGRILFVPGAQFADAWEYPDHCGWTIGKDGDGDWSLLYVGADTPAEQAGLAAGDKLIELGGEETTAVSREQLRSLSGREGPLAGVILRGTQRRSFDAALTKLI